MTNALSPAKVQRVSIVDDRDRVMEVVVEDKQLSLAIGKKGQNVRLAAKLTGWRIDIKSEEEKRREIEAQLEGLTGGSPTDASADESGPRPRSCGPATSRWPPRARRTRPRPSRATQSLPRRPPRRRRRTARANPTRGSCQRVADRDVA